MVLSLVPAACLLPAGGFTSPAIDGYGNSGCSIGFVVLIGGAGGGQVISQQWFGCVLWPCLTSVY